MVKTVVISGYYGFDNLGDEAILYSLIKMLKKRQNQLEIYVLSDSPKITAKRYGVKTVNRNNLVEIIKTLKKSELFVSGGGSLLQDITSIRSVPYYLGLVFLADIMRNKTTFYAQGIGPLNKIFSRKLVKWIGNRTDLITVRDQDSAELLKNIGINTDLIEKTVDPVYGLHSELENDKLKNDFIINFLNKKEIDIKTDNLIGISVRPWADNSYLEAVAKAGDDLFEKSNGKIIILPMYLNEDLEVCQRVKKKMKYPAVLWERQLTPSEMISFFSIFDFFVGVRLHSLIFAALNEIPFLGISYDPKVDSLLKDLKLETNLTTEDCDYSDLKNVINDFWNNQEKISESLKEKMKLHKLKAQDNVDKVLEL